MRSKKANVVFILNDITRRAGTERAVVNQANILCRNDRIEQIFIASLMSFKGSSAFRLDDKVKLIHLGISRPAWMSTCLWLKIFVHICTWYSLLKIVLSKKCSVVIGTDASINCVLTLVPLRFARIGCEHFNYDTRQGMMALKRKLLYRFLDAVVLLTGKDAENYNFIAENKRYVIPNSVEEVTELSSLNEKRIIAAGRLVHVKGFDMLIRAAVEIKKALPDWHIDIFGSGEQLETLNKLSCELQVDDYVSVKLPVEDLQREFVRSSIFVLSSRVEPFGLVLIEAQACGLPVVSFDCPFGPSEIIKNNSGFLVEPGDCGMFAEKIILLAKDEDLRKK